MSLLRALATAIAPNPVSIGSTTKKAHYDLLYDAIVVLEGQGFSKIAAEFTARRAVTAGNAVSLDRGGQVVPQVGFRGFAAGSFNELTIFILSQVEAQTGTTFAHVYNPANDLKVRLGTVAANGTITYGAATTIDTGVGGTSQFCVRRLDATRCVVVYEDLSVIEAVIITESAGTYSVGTPVTVQSPGAIHGMEICAVLSATNFVCIFEDTASNDLDARAGTISGSTITLGTTVQIRAGVKSGDPQKDAICDAGSGAAFILYTIPFPTQQLFYETITVSGNTITTGSETALVDTGVNTGFNPRCHKVADGFILAYVDLVHLQVGQVEIHVFPIVIADTPTDLARVGAPMVIPGGDDDTFGPLSIGASFNLGKGFQFDAKTAILPYQLASGTSFQLDAAGFWVVRLKGDNSLEPNYMAYTFRDTGVEAELTGITDLKPAGATGDFVNRFVAGFADDGVDTFSKVFEYYEETVGIAETSQAATESVVVQMLGLADTGLSGLQKGDFIWASPTGALGVGNQREGRPIGFALSGTEILMMRGDPWP